MSFPIVQAPNPIIVFLDKSGLDQRFKQPPALATPFRDAFDHFIFYANKSAVRLVLRGEYP